jgi:hypothetical protein
MKTFLSKTVLACSVAAASFFTASVAQADTIFNAFTISHTEAGLNTQFNANKITGDYVEVITFAGSVFNVSLFWKAGQFSEVGGAGAYDALDSRLGIDYGLYGFYHASGTVAIGPDSFTTFTFTPGTGSLQLYLDENTNTKYNALTGNPLTGSGAFTLTGTTDDIVVANGTPLAGSGTLNPAGCGFKIGINCGSFGSTTSFSLTNPAGTSFFLAPSPFYDLSFQSGQLNNFTPTGTVTINGSLDVVFSRAVPEPSSTALLGLGLLGLGFTARRRKQS